MLIDELLALGDMPEVDLTNTPCFDVTNVAKYFYLQNPKEVWNREDFPDCRPPFGKIWMEYKAPQETYSKECGYKDYRKDGIQSWVAGLIETHPETKRVNMRIHVFIRKGKELSHWPMAQHTYLLGPDRLTTDEVTYIPKPDTGSYEDATGLYQIQFQPLKLALSFMNCRNTEIISVDHPPALQKARVKRGGKPFISYNIVNISPVLTHKQVQKKATAGEQSSMPLHIRRGHYARYGPAYGRGLLFGKYEGMYWIESSVVGSLQNGISEHVYVSNAPV